MTKGISATLFSKTLSSITFWGYLFLLPWTNYKFHYGSVLPNWIENVSLYLSLGLAIPLLSLLANYLKTVSTRDSENLIIYELVNISFEDSEFVTQGVKIFIKRSKTDQSGEGTLKAIPYFDNHEFCPVITLKKYIR